MPDINWLGVIAATIAAFAVGSLWYSPLLFVKTWQREAGITEEMFRNANMVKMMGGTLVLLFLASFVFSMFLGPEPSLQLGIGAGFSAGLFWVAGALGIHYLYEMRSLKLWLINGGFNVATFTTIGLVLALLA